jgi:CheY-like chemotaxis protein
VVVEHRERPDLPALLSALLDQHERVAAHLRRVEALLCNALEKLDSSGINAGDDAASDGSERNPSPEAPVVVSGSGPPAWDVSRRADGAPSILVVDLYESSRVALGELIRSSGYPVLEARSSFDLPTDGTSAPLLIVFDPGPHLDAGLRTIARMRIQEEAPVPVVLLTATPTPEQRDRALAIGCSEVLGKPCVPAELLSVVRRLVGPPPSRIRPEIPSLAAQVR